MTRAQRLQKAEDLLLAAQKIVEGTIVKSTDRAQFLAELAAEWIALGDATEDAHE